MGIMRTVASVGIVALTASGLAACSSGPSGEETAWAGAMCTATTNAVLASNIVVNELPPPEQLSDTTLSLYQARLGTEIAQQSDAVEGVSAQLGTAPKSLSDAVSSLQQPVADLSAAFTASGVPLSAVTGAADAKSATAAMGPARAAAQKTQAAAVAVVTAIQATGNKAFTESSACQFPGLSASATASASASS